MSEGQRPPKAFVIDEPEEKTKSDEPKRKPRAITGITFEPEIDEGELIVMPPTPLPSPRSIRWGSILIGALFTLVTLWAGLAITQLIEDYFARAPALGWIALGVATIAGLAALAIILREVWALARLRRIEHIQTDAAHAINTDDAAAAKRAVSQLQSLYAGRADAALGLKELKQYDADIMDGRDRMRLAERHLVEWRDGEAHRIIAHAARRITFLTTVAPTPALDILFVAAQNLRMMRELATLYGGRPSTLATIRLARMVISHLAVTGGIALSDNLIQHVVGKGLLGRLSARFGEGAVNGILTARVGLAARDVCRPIPQETSAKETLGSLMKELVSSAEGQKPE
ncbi:YcjF family protein [Aestuariivirga sp.]|uniref:YcjF family protein n=1 Tax=Aestuariivirga sp. TaxID=2650926 RepID=UPI0035941071